jgi:hypothetical protein
VDQNSNGFDSTQSLSGVGDNKIKKRKRKKNDTSLLNESGSGDTNEPAKTSGIISTTTPKKANTKTSQLPIKDSIANENNNNNPLWVVMLLFVIWLLFFIYKLYKNR